MKQQVWRKQLTIALVREDLPLLEDLLSDLPKLESMDEVESVILLLKQAGEMVQKKKQQTYESMQQIRKNIDFLQSGVADVPSHFDITS